MRSKAGRLARAPRLSRELSRLFLAAVLLLVGGVSSALTGVPVAGNAERGSIRPATRSRLFRQPSPRRSGQSEFAPAEVAELERQDQAFRVIAGLEPVGSITSAGTEAGTASGHLRLLWTLDTPRARDAYTVSVDLGSVIRRARRESFSWRAAEDSIVELRERVEATPSLLPARGYISSGFSRARPHPILHLRRPHLGLDIVAPYGTPIVASAPGRVSRVGYNGEYGLSVEIDHGHGVMTRYAHASRALVREGQRVSRGDTIARVGRSGLADGSHVHYEVLVNGEHRNPRHYIFEANVIPD